VTEDDLRVVVVAPFAAALVVVDWSGVRQHSVVDVCCVEVVPLRVVTLSSLPPQAASIISAAAARTRPNFIE
jgi:hypothetical protein